MSNPVEEAPRPRGEGRLLPKAVSPAAGALSWDVSRTGTVLSSLRMEGYHVLYLYIHTYII